MKKGITLIEAVLALALVALILASLTGILNVSLKSWRMGSERDEVIQNGRVAMDRIISDLRYAVSISRFRQAILEFDTVYLENEDDYAETISYYKSGTGLYRSVDGQANPPEIAGYIDDFDITLHSTGGQQTIHAAQAASARIDLTLVNGDETFTITSGAHMRYYGD